MCGRAGRSLPAPLCSARGWRLFRQRRFLLCTCRVLQAVMPAFPGGRGRPGVRHGTAPAGAQSWHSAPAAAQEHLQTAGTPKLHLSWESLTARDCTGSSVDVCEHQDQSAIPAFPTPLPLCLPAWDHSLSSSYSGCLWVTHSSRWREQNKHSSKAQAETGSRITSAAEIFSI